MKTEDLIAVIAADAMSVPPSTGRRLLLGLCASLAVAALALLATIGVRADIGVALATWRFDVKLLLVAAAIVAALVDCLRLSRPTETKGIGGASALAGALLLVAIAVELFVTPGTEWRAKLVGTNAALCLVTIPLLAAAPLAILLIAMRGGAPASPALAGAAVGRLAAATGAALYALHCFDDSPLFVATWYVAAMVVVTLAGAAIGRRALRW